MALGTSGRVVTSRRLNALIAGPRQVSGRSVRTYAGSGSRSMRLDGRDSGGFDGPGPDDAPRRVDHPAHRLRAGAGPADPAQGRHPAGRRGDVHLAPLDLPQRLGVVLEVAAGEVGLGEVGGQVPPILGEVGEGLARGPHTLEGGNAAAAEELGVRHVEEVLAADALAGLAV